MPSQEATTDNAPETLTNHPPIPKEFHPDLARHIIDTQPLRVAFYGIFCGWREELKEVETKNALGKPVKKFIQVIVVSKVRLSNEDGGDYLYDTIYPLVAPFISTSKLSSWEIYNTWRGRLRELRWTLYKKIQFGGNPFNMKKEDLPEIISNLAQLYLITKKAEGGWTLNKIADQYSSMLVLRGGAETGGTIGMMPQKQEGILDKALNSIWHR